MNYKFKRYLDDFLDEVILYDDYYNGHNYKNMLKGYILNYCDSPTEYNALNIYEIFFKIYQITNQDKSKMDFTVIKQQIANEPNIPWDFTKIMFKYEKIRKLRPTCAPVHSVNVFLLGLAVYSQNKKFQEIFKNHVLKSPYKKYYRIDGKLSHEEFLYRWAITSLFHNIAISSELLSKSLQKLLNEELNTVFKCQGENIKLDLLNYKRLDSIAKIKHDFADKYNEQYIETKFLDLFKPTDILIHKLSLDFDLNQRQQNILKENVENLLFDCPCKEDNLTDHGVISSISILDIYGYLIQKYNKDPDFFFYPIVDSSSAILLENLYRNLLQREPFNQKQLDPNKNPLAFLLILCRELMIQINPPDGIDEADYKIEFDIEVTDKSLDLRYVIKNGNSNIYTEDLKLYLEIILDLKQVFNYGLFFESEMLSQNLRIDKQEELNSQYVSMELIYKVAKALHKDYNKYIKKEYQEAKDENDLDEDLIKKYENICEFDELQSSFKINYIRQAKSIFKQLHMIGYDVITNLHENIPIHDFSEDEIIKMAIIEHEEWCQEKLGMGWKYDSVRDKSKKTHECLVHWDDLEPEIQKYYIDTVKNIPKIVNSLGLKIVSSK